MAQHLFSCMVKGIINAISLLIEDFVHAPETGRFMSKEKICQFILQLHVICIKGAIAIGIRMTIKLITGQIQQVCFIGQAVGVRYGINAVGNHSVSRMLPVTRSEVENRQPHGPVVAVVGHIRRIEGLSPRIRRVRKGQSEFGAAAGQRGTGVGRKDAPDTPSVHVSRIIIVGDLPYLTIDVCSVHEQIFLCEGNDGYIGRETVFHGHISLVRARRHIRAAIGRFEKETSVLQV